MTKKIKVPDDIEKAEERLVTLDGIANTTGWERAAIVYAFTKEGTGGPRTGGISGQLTIRQFAELKIVGLKDRDAISFHRSVWQEAIDKGEVLEAVPGQAVVLPTRVYPVQKGNQGTRATPTNIRNQMANDPALLKAAVNAAADLDPKEVANQAAKPKVARSIVHNKAATKSVIQQQNAKTKRVIKRRDPNVADEINEVLGTEQQLTDAMSTSSHFNKMRQLLGLMNNLWIDGTKKQVFKPVDRHFLGTDILRWRELLEEFDAFVEADDDPYDAVKAIRKERVDITDRELDDLELNDGDSIDAGIEDLERFANEGIA